MGAREPLVSVVLTSHARPGLIGEALASVVAQSCRDREVLVVDNHSELSGEIAAVVAGFAEARLIASPDNLGFPGAVNLGLQHARGRYVMVTEDDIALPPDCLDVLVAHLEAHPEIGVATGRLVEITTGKVLYAGGDVALDAVFKMSVPGRGEPDRDFDPAPLPVTYVPGGMMLVRRSLVERIGGMRADFFMYYEDVEFSLRVLVAGSGCSCLRGLRLTHRASPPTGNVVRVEYHKIKNLRALYLLLAPARVLPEFLLRYAIIEPLQALVRQPSRFLLMARSLAWVFGHLPRLVRDRRRISALRAAPTS